MKFSTMVVIGIVVFCAAIIAGVILGTCGKAVNTASEMADQTVFNADRHVQTYENFHDN
jgi:hypothetical protein